MLCIGRRRRACLLLAGLLLCLPLAGLGEDSADAELNLRLESRLSELGYFTEVPDETGDESTRIALSNFQTANGLEPTGSLDNATTNRLRREDAVEKQAYLSGLAEHYGALQLASGAIGREVSAMQRRLAELGYYEGSADSVYGDATGEAVALFQMSVGLNVTGTADGATLFRLIEGAPPARDTFLGSMCAEKGDTGSNVKQVQQRLRRMGFFRGDCTGTYGEMTVHAVERFQQESALPATGQLNPETCAALFSLQALRAQETAIPRLGDAGEDVRELQTQLATLGYYEGAVDGQYDYDTEVAYRLYQIGNELPLDPRAPVDAGQALPLDAVEANLQASQRHMTGDTAARVAQTANALLGQPFAEETATRFPGFSFVQYALAENGVACEQPGEIVGSASARLGRTDRPDAGSVVILEVMGDEGTQMRLTISLGLGRLALVDESGSWVVASELRLMDFQNAYLWTPEAEDA